MGQENKRESFIIYYSLCDDKSKDFGRFHFENEIEQKEEDGYEISLVTKEFVIKI